MALTQEEAKTVVEMTILAQLELHMYNDEMLGEDPLFDTLLVKKDGQLFYLWDGRKVTGGVDYVSIANLLANMKARSDDLYQGAYSLIDDPPMGYYDGHLELDSEDEIAHIKGDHIGSFEIVETFEGLTAYMNN